MQKQTIYPEITWTVIDHLHYDVKAQSMPVVVVRFPRKIISWLVIGQARGVCDSLESQTGSQTVQTEFNLAEISLRYLSVLDVQKPS